MSSKLITIYVDGTQLTVKKLDLNDTLDKIRQKLADKISESSLFTLESGDKIEISDESELKLEDILVDNKKLCMTQASNKESSSKKKNTPIEGSKLIENIGKLKIYQYPEVKLTEIE